MWSSKSPTIILRILVRHTSNSDTDMGSHARSPLIITHITLVLRLIDRCGRLDAPYPHMAVPSTRRDQMIRTPARGGPRDRSDRKRCGEVVCRRCWAPWWCVAQGWGGIEDEERERAAGGGELDDLCGVWGVRRVVGLKKVGFGKGEERTLTRPLTPLVAAMISPQCRSLHHDTDQPPSACLSVSACCFNA